VVEVAKATVEVAKPIVETVKPTYVIDVPVKEPIVEKSRPAYKPTPKPTEPVVKAQPKEKAPKKELKERAGYVSRLETVIDAPKTLEKKDEKPIRKKPKSEAEERRLRASDIRKDKDYDIKPEYTPEELEEIAKQQELEAKNTWYEEEIDFDEFEDYYEEE